VVEEGRGSACERGTARGEVAAGGETWAEAWCGFFRYVKKKYVHAIIRLKGSFVSSRARGVLAAALGLRN
jgi:hypothetical protein